MIFSAKPTEPTTAVNLDKPQSAIQNTDRVLKLNPPWPLRQLQ
jgi:hypothetical protein